MRNERRLPDWYPFMPLKKISAAFTNSLLLVVCLLSLSAPVASEASETRIHPDLLVSEEYNDNVFLTPDGRVLDYITRIDPGIALIHNATFWDVDLRYVYDYRYYAYSSYEDASSQMLHGLVQTRLIGNLLLLDIKDDYERVSLDVARNYTEESNFINQTDRNVVNVNPRAVFRPSSQTTLTAGYNFIDTWYKEKFGINTIQHVISIGMLQDISPTTVFNSTILTEKNDNSLASYRKDEILIGPTFSFAADSTAVFTVGYDHLSFENDGQDRHFIWSVNAVYRYAQYSASLDAGRSYSPDPERVVRREDRYKVEVGRVTEKNTFLLFDGIRQYREPGTDLLESKVHEDGVTLVHGMGEKTRLAYSFIVDRFVQTQQERRSSLYLSIVRFEWRPLEPLTTALEYRWSQGESPSHPGEEYKNNRIVLEITKQF